MANAETRRSDHVAQHDSRVDAADFLVVTCASFLPDRCALGGLPTVPRPRMLSTVPPAYLPRLQNSPAQSLLSDVFTLVTQLLKYVTTV